MNKSAHNNTSYDPYIFVSKCCKAFIFYDSLSVYCSKCGKEVYKIGDDEDITISIKFSSKEHGNNLSGDVLQSFYNRLPRYATDRTCDVCTKKCPMCESLTRYLRDPSGNIVYVCSNGECRHVIV